MIPPLLAVTDGVVGIPRESGDDPGTLHLTAKAFEYSPRERG